MYFNLLKFWKLSTITLIVLTFIFIIVDLSLSINVTRSEDAFLNEFQEVNVPRDTIKRFDRSSFPGFRTKIQVYHSLFCIFFILTSIVGCVGIQVENSILILCFSIVTFISGFVRLFIYVNTDEIMGLKKDYLSLGAEEMEITVLLFYQITSVFGLLAAVFIKSQYI